MSTTNKERAAAFIENLRRLRHLRGVMASLARGLSDATCNQAWPIVARFAHDFDKTAPRMVAAFYGLHPKEDMRFRTFGATCRKIALADSSDGKMPDSFERRFRRLLASDSDADVANQVKAWVRFAASKNIGLNFVELFESLASWPWADDRIKLRWAQDFWAPRRDETEEAEPAPVAK